MANKLSKTRPVDEPYAIFESNGGGIKWHILKTYKTPASEKKGSVRSLVRCRV
jgi:hypothetical protein